MCSHSLIYSNSCMWSSLLFLNCSSLGWSPTSSLLCKVSLNEAENTFNMLQVWNVSAAGADTCCAMTLLGLSRDLCWFNCLLCINGCEGGSILQIFFKSSWINKSDNHPIHKDTHTNKDKARLLFFCRSHLDAQTYTLLEFCFFITNVIPLSIRPSSQQHIAAVGTCRPAGWRWVRGIPPSSPAKSHPVYKRKKKNYLSYSLCEKSDILFLYISYIPMKSNDGWLQ